MASETPTCLDTYERLNKLRAFLRIQTVLPKAVTEPDGVLSQQSDLI
jgi:hypothetical protein